MDAISMALLELRKHSDWLQKRKRNHKGGVHQMQSLYGQNYKDENPRHY